MKIKEIAKKNQYMVMLICFLAVLLVFFSITKGGTLWTLSTWKGMMQQMPQYGVMTVGLAFCFIIGNIDLSFVALGDFACIVSVLLMSALAGDGATGAAQVGIVIIGILVVFAIAAVGGFINGLLVAKLGIPPVVATIAMQLCWTGLSIAITGGDTVKGVPSGFTSLINSSIFGFIPVTLIVFVLVFILAVFLLKKTTYGEKLYMVGTNKKACKFSAINTDMMEIGTFMLTDVIASVGALLMVASYSSAKADYGESYVMRCILILVLSGILPDGGIGKISNLILGLASIQIIATCINMFSKLNTYYSSLIWGAMLIIVLILSTKLGTGEPLFKRKAKTTEAKS